MCESDDAYIACLYPKYEVLVKRCTQRAGKFDCWSGTAATVSGSMVGEIIGGTGYLLSGQGPVCQLLVLQPLNMLVQLFRKGRVIIGGNVFILVSILERAGGYNPALSFYGDDADPAVRLGRYGQILFTRKITVKLSSRRYEAKGFLRVQAQHTKAYIQTLFNRRISAEESIELAHPRLSYAITERNSGRCPLFL